MNPSTPPSASGIAAVPGFRLAASSADVRGLRDHRLDMALIVSDVPETTGAAVFTQNDVKAAPVKLGLASMESNRGVLRAILINSGNANACTGLQGDQDAQAMAEATATSLGIPSNQVLVCSTGRIGRALPMDRIMPKIPELIQGVNDLPETEEEAAQAILTSDTRPKLVCLTGEIQGQTFTIGGMAKGAGMIQPDMATMLAHLCSDVRLSPDLALNYLRKATADTFNAITVDGDMSTNDTVTLQTNGLSGICIDDLDTKDQDTFFKLLEATCWDLARKIVGDGEKISKVVELQITGAPDKTAAEAVARCIGNSLLVKTSWYGSDPNWGRLLDAAGYAKVGLKEDSLSLAYNAIPVIEHGEVQAERESEWKAVVSLPEFSITLDLGLGDAAFRLLTSDLTEAYVDFNKSE